MKQIECKNGCGVVANIDTEYANASAEKLIADWHLRHDITCPRGPNSGYHGEEKQEKKKSLFK